MADGGEAITVVASNFLTDVIGRPGKFIDTIIIIKANTSNIIISC